MSRSSIPHSWVRRRPQAAGEPPIGVYRRVPGRRGRAWSFGRTSTRVLAVLTAVALPLGLTHGLALAAAPPGNGFVVTAGDIGFILKQIKIAERHTATLTPANPCGTLVGPNRNQVPDILTSYGLRTVDGSCNNLKPGSEKFAAADVPFPRLTTPAFKDAEPITPAFPVGPPGPTSYKQKNPGNAVIDSQPRVISNLIVDQTSTNPAAIAAAGNPVRAQNHTATAFPCTTDPDPTALPPVDAVPAGCTPAHKTLFIPNITTDTGLSPPFNSWFTFFGQFFDHGVDQTVKSNGTVFVPLRADDPLITVGPDGKPNTGDEVTPQNAFMVLTRAQNQPGPDGVLGTADDVQDATNTDTPWVDQSQTYTSHPSHQVFLREYTLVAGKPAATGKLLGGLPAGAAYPSAPDGQGGISTWFATKKQAAEVLGLKLVDADVTNIPMLAVDPYGNFIPGPARGLPQFVTATGLVEGDLAAPVPVPANVLHFDAPFLTDIAHNSDPSPQDADHNPATPPTVPTPDADNVPNADFASQPAGTYDDEGLNSHFACGDGRCNENIALSAVHQIFHSEHDRLVDDIRNTLNQPGNAALKADFENVAPVAVDDPKPFTVGERYFQAARFVTEMEYQHLVFEEFARKVQPAVRPFHVYSPDINPAIEAEFAHAVYRFGHSMLDDTVARVNEDPTTGAKTPNSVPLLTAFLNPSEYFNSGDPATPYTPQQAAGAIIMGSSDQTGNEIDEFVTETLRNNLLGLPLDLPTLNMARAREAGVKSLNGLRRDIFGQTNDGALAPYLSWSDFGQHLKHPESLVNFVAAYGTHPSIRDSGPDGIAGNADDVTTVAAKRAAARAIVDPFPGNPTATPPIPADVAPADAADFMFGTGAWADAAGITTTGLDDVDLWVGGLAELTNQNGGLLGSTFNYVFQTQLEKLQDGDRLYYLARTPGLNLRTQLEGNSFSELIQRNTQGTHTLKADAFGTADCKFELSHLDGTPAGFTASGAVVADDPTSPCNENALLQRRPDGTIFYKAINSVDPSGINGQSVYNGNNVDLAGRPGSVNDRITGGIDNDTIWGNAGNDVIEGNNGDDIALGGEGNDIITDIAGADVPKGGPGNDAIDGGIGDDIVMGNEGVDFLNGGANDNETFAGEGNDFIIAGQGADAVFGDGGDDWIEGGTGQDLLQGDHGAPFFDDPGQTAPGNDIFVGQVGENDYDAEGGDDVMSQNAAVDRNAGSGGFDWAFHQFDGVKVDQNGVPTRDAGGATTPNGVNADDDLMINNNLGGLPIQVIVNRDRWQETEADSGGPGNDVIKGTDGVLGTPRLVGGGGFSGCDALDAAGVARIKGLDQLVTTFPGQAADVAALSVSGRCPLTGPVWGEGDILLGGPGSDTITGRSGNEIIDGDRALGVAISVRTNAADPATEIGRTDLMENKAISGNFGAGTTGMTLQQAVFAGKVDPGNLVGVREIVNTVTAPGDCGVAAPVNCDTAVFAGPRSQYTITPGPNGSTIVTDTTTVPPAPGVPSKGDGTDTLTHMEQLQFSDGTVLLTAPAAPSGVTATAGNASATVSWTAPAPNGSTIASYDINVTTGTTTTLVTGVPATPTTRLISLLTNGASYTFQVRAVSNIGVAGPFSAPSTAVTPTAPAAPAPVVTSRTPVAGATNVAATSTVTATFNVAMIAGGFRANTVQLRNAANAVVAGTVAYNAATRTVTFTPNAPLALGTVFTMTLTGGAGNIRSGTATAPAFVTTSWSFTTVAPALPGAPTIGTSPLAPVGPPTQVIARFTPPASTGGAPITGYQITATPTAGVATVVTAGPGPAAGARNVTIVVPDGTYRMTVRAITSAGTGPASAASNAVVAR